MGSVAKFPVNASGAEPDEDQLKTIAFERYCNGAGQHIKRVAQFVGLSEETIKAWATSESWAQRRAAFRRDQDRHSIEDVLSLLQRENLKDNRESAVQVLKLCQRAMDLAKQGLDECGKNGVHPDSLAKLVTAIERVQKIQRDAYGRL